MTESRAQQKRDKFLRHVADKMNAMRVMSNFFFVGVSDIRSGGTFYVDAVVMGSAPTALAAANALLLEIRDAALAGGIDASAETITRIDAAIAALGVRSLTAEQAANLERST
ncbi:MAG: hypothetical protein Q7S99_03105 [Parvibaculum sp.]|nr:hypothetical protein [Parvibaculum sp.]